MNRSILAVVVLGLALAGCNTSYNYFEDDTEGAPDPGPFNLAHSLMKHSGVVPKDKQRLAYKPRAPLAMPGSTDLPAPQDGANSAQDAVNFPVDQAEQNAARRAELARAMNGDDGTTGMRDEITGPAARQGLARLPAEALAKPPQETNKEVFRDEHPVKTMKEMRKKLNLRKPQTELLTAEGTAAPRKYLIQPPDEYRTPASTAPLPEEGDIENSEWIDKQLYRGVKTKPHGYVQ